MNNIKLYCEHVHKLLLKRSLLSPPPVFPPVRNNGIILLSFMEDGTLLADMFTLMDVTEEENLTHLTAVNRKGNAVSGTWIQGRYVWQNDITDLQTFIREALQQCHSLSFRQICYHWRRIKVVVQCAKDQIPLCQDLLPDTCEYADVLRWARPPKKGNLSAIYATQALVVVLLFMGLSPIYFIVASFALILAYHFAHKQLIVRYIKENPATDDSWVQWLETSGELLDRPGAVSLERVETEMNALFNYTIERTSPGFDMLMRTRHRIAQEMLEDIAQHDEFPRIKFARYRQQLIKFMLNF